LEILAILAFFLAKNAVKRFFILKIPVISNNAFWAINFWPFSSKNNKPLFFKTIIILLLT
jgi:hypothetical protein